MVVDTGHIVGAAASDYESADTICRQLLQLCALQIARDSFVLTFSVVSPDLRICAANWQYYSLTQVNNAVANVLIRVGYHSLGALFIRFINN